MAKAPVIPPVVIPFGTTGRGNDAAVPIDYPLIKGPLDYLLFTFINRLFGPDYDLARWRGSAQADEVRRNRGEDAVLVSTVTRGSCSPCNRARCAQVAPQNTAVAATPNSSP